MPGVRLWNDEASPWYEVAYFSCRGLIFCFVVPNFTKISTGGAACFFATIVPRFLSKNEQETSFTLFILNEIALLQQSILYVNEWP